MKKRILTLVLSLAVLFCFTSSSIFAQNTYNMGAQKPRMTNQQTADQMVTTNTYMIKFPHTAKTCLSLLDELSSDSPEILDKIEWGCLSGDHTGYMIVNSKNEVAALQLLPAPIRNEVKVEKLDKFSMAQIEALHKNQ